MRAYYGFDNLPVMDNPAVAVGSFDGVHRGHRLLVNELVTVARANNGKSVLVTFDPHPRQLLRGENRLLTTLDEKLELLAETELDCVVVVNFTLEFSRLSHTEFLEKYIRGKLNVHTLLNGEGHYFGHNRQGDDKKATQHGLTTRKLARYRNISSTQIRNCIECGKVAEAVELLSTNGYLIKTPIIDNAKLLPPDSVYRVLIDGKEHVINIMDVKEMKFQHNIRIMSEI